MLTEIEKGTTPTFRAPVLVPADASRVFTRLVAADTRSGSLLSWAIEPVLSSTSASSTLLSPHCTVELAATGS